MDYCVETNQLCKNYGGVKALEDLSLVIPQGAIYGLIGRNGSGKTTLLRLLSGLQEPTSGSYSLFHVKNLGKEIGQSRRRIGFIVDRPSFYENLTAEENLHVQYKLLGLPSTDRIPELIELVGLKDAGGIKAGDFSTGMRQRMGLALALAGAPDALFLDEPSNGLDPWGIIDMREILLRLNRERQVTILIASHILDELSRMATHYCFIDKGRVIREMSVGDLEAVLHKSVYLRVVSTRMLTPVLDDMGLKYQILSNMEVQIFSEVNISRLVLTLAQKGCEVNYIQHHDESLESFFMRMLGGGDIEKAK